MSLKRRRQPVPRWGSPCVTSTSRSVIMIRWITCHVPVCAWSLLVLLLMNSSLAGIHPRFHQPGALPHTAELFHSPLLTSLQFRLTYSYFSVFSPPHLCTPVSTQIYCYPMPCGFVELYWILFPSYFQSKSLWIFRVFFTSDETDKQFSLTSSLIDDNSRFCPFNSDKMLVSVALISVYSNCSSAIIVSKPIKNECIFIFSLFLIIRK